jgi:hypothetical protein
MASITTGTGPRFDPFAPEVLADPYPSTAAALLDRLLHHAIVVVTSGESWRLKEARARVALGLPHLTPGTDTDQRKED